MKRNILFLILCSFVKLEAQTAQIIGGNIRYEALGNNQYKIIGILNRRCDGPAMGMPIMSIFSNSSIHFLSINRTKIEDISTKCSGANKPCYPQNTQTNKGIEQHTFETTINFNDTPFSIIKQSGKVFFSLEETYRSDSLTTLDNGLFYTEAMIDFNVLGQRKNTCPSNSQSYNSVFMCLNNPTYLYNEMKDNIDKDSLAYTPAHPMNANSSNESYKDNFKPTIPMTPYCPPNPGVIFCKPLPNAYPPRGFYFGELDGNIILTPTKLEVATIVVKCTEYRKINGTYKEIGYVLYDFVAEVIQCQSNNPPQITNQTVKFSVCEGDKLCFTVLSKDDPFLPQQTSYDTVSLNWDSAINNATFKIIDPNAREKQAEICWQTKLGDGNKVSQFTVIAKDDFCPNQGVSFKSFSILVKPKANAIRKYIKKLNNKLIFEALTDSINSFQWSIRDSTNAVILKQSFNKKDSFTFQVKGKYIVNLLVNFPINNCPTNYYDTIIIDGSVTTSIDFKIKLKPIKVYPNPTTKILNIELRKDEKFTTMKLYNLQGKVVLEKTLEPTIDMSQYENGIYTLEIIGENGRYYTKVIKE